MTAWVYWLAWIICYFIGGVLLYWQDAPGWAATIGGWVFSWGVMGQHRETR